MTGRTNRSCTKRYGISASDNLQHLQISRTSGAPIQQVEESKPVFLDHYILSDPNAPPNDGMYPMMKPPSSVGSMPGVRDEKQSVCSTSCDLRPIGHVPLGS